MSKNSQARRNERRKSALTRRLTNLNDWQKKLSGDSDNKELQRKVELATAEVETLKKRVGVQFNA